MRRVAQQAVAYWLVCLALVFSPAQVRPSVGWFEAVVQIVEVVSLAPTQQVAPSPPKIRITKIQRVGPSVSTHSNVCHAARQVHPVAPQQKVPLYLRYKSLLC
ncbi:MAG: hypothetical protein IPK82_43050 [Polyangiaceae bacterium]|nr:hypothetical protein [Polyangiaceae bacterium]